LYWLLSQNIDNLAIFAGNLNIMENKSLTSCFKQDPQSNLSITISEGLCEVTFLLWDLDDQEVTTHKGRLIFHGCWAAEYLGVETNTCDRSSEPCLPNIFLSAIGKSHWLSHKTQQRAEIYPTWLTWDKNDYIHYLLRGHDHRIQVLARSFEFQIVAWESPKF
jgi:hypothetical protein